VLFVIGILVLIAALFLLGGLFFGLGDSLHRRPSEIGDAEILNQKQSWWIAGVVWMGIVVGIVGIFLELPMNAMLLSPRCKYQRHDER